MAEDAGGYIKHHLTNLTFGKHPDGRLGASPKPRNRPTEMRFLAIHLDSMFWSLVLGVVCSASYSGQPLGRQRRGYRGGCRTGSR